jgi:hypothetical protein
MSDVASIVNSVLVMLILIFFLALFHFSPLQTEHELTPYLVHNRLAVTSLERWETLVVNKQHAQLNYWILRGKVKAVFRIPA